MPNTDPKKKKIMVKVPKDFELTKRYSDVRKKIVANTNSQKGDVVENKVLGINIDKKTSVATPKEFRRKVVTSPTNTKIIGTDGKVIYEGRNESEATKKALKDSERHTNITSQQRENNANAYNVNVGSKKELTDKDINSLINRKSAN